MAGPSVVDCDDVPQQFGIDARSTGESVGSWFCACDLASWAWPGVARDTPIPARWEMEKNILEGATGRAAGAADVFGSPVHVKRYGLGSPTLLLHGNPDSSVMWLPLIEQLRDRCDCIAPDLPGFGQTPVPTRNEATLDWAAEWVDALIDELAIETPLDLVVHDVGGFVGLAWAVRYPHRVRRIVVTNTIFQADYEWHFWARVWRRRGLGEFAMSLLGLPLIGRALFASTLRIGGPGLSREQIAEICDGFGPVTRAQVLHLYRATDPANFTGWEEKMIALAEKVPTRVIWGDRDPFIESRYAERFGTRDVHHLPDVGHWVAAEAPTRMAALVREHFER